MRSGIHTGVLSDIFCDIRSGIHLGVLSGISSHILAAIIFDISSGILPGILAAVSSPAVPDLELAVGVRQDRGEGRGGGLGES